MAFGILSGCDGCILFYIFLPLGIQITIPGSHVDYGPTDEKVTNGGTCPPQGVWESWGLTPANSCQASTSSSFFKRHWEIWLF